jgi:preprotein translocase subunit SecG
LFGFLLVVLLLVGLFMSVVVLLQAGKGGGLAAMGGGGGGTGADNLIGGRQAATLLTKSTWVSGGLFLFLALVLSVVSSRQTRPESVLRGTIPAAAPAVPQPVLPGMEPQTDGAAPTGPIQPAPEGAAGGGAPEGVPPQP